MSETLQASEYAVGEEEMGEMSAPQATARRGKTGPKPGQPHSGQFKPGPDPRRYVPSSERVQARKTLEETCRELTTEAVEALTALLRSPTTPAKEVRATAEVILEHGWGSPVTKLAVATMPSHSGMMDPRQLSLADLRQRAEQAVLDREQPAIEGEVIGELTDDDETPDTTG